MAFRKLVKFHLAYDPLALHLLFQNPKSLIDVVVANEYLHLPSIQIVAAVTAVSLSEAARAAAAGYGRDMIDEIGEHTYRREDMGQRRSDLSCHKPTCALHA